ncbi:unnamed protein product [Arabis nemorensis]|uniref:Uncharacterized protein n=1 Tax=Arabis nemorensis TaxID=586526 RepID=A0A565BSA6_9BRAS|nr:unnamed protein product [Arabis nemorensis]
MEDPSPDPPDSCFRSPPPSSILVGRSFSVASPVFLESPSGRSSLAGFGFNRNALPLDNLFTLHHRRFMPKISLDLNGTRSESSDSYRRIVTPSPGYVSLRFDSVSQLHGRRLKSSYSTPSPRARVTVLGPSNLPLSIAGHDPRSNKGVDELLNCSVPSPFLVVVCPEHSPSPSADTLDSIATITTTKFGLGLFNRVGF